MTDNITLICPENDLESQIIVEIAKNKKMDVRVSPQTWGANLANEPQETFTDLKEIVYIVEIPGPEKENELRLKGHKVVIIDHHRYASCDRSHTLSSLEQFANKIGHTLTVEQNIAAVNDRSYIWGLAAMEPPLTYTQISQWRRKDLAAQGWTDEQLSDCNKTYLSLALALARHDALSSRNNAAPGAIFCCEVSLDRTGYLTDLIHLPDEYFLYLWRKNPQQYGRANILIRNHAGNEIDFSGSYQWREKLAEVLDPLSEYQWAGGAGYGCFGGWKIKDEKWQELGAAVENLKSVEDRQAMSEENSNTKCHATLHAAPIEKFTSFMIFPFFRTDGHPVWPDKKNGARHPFLYHKMVRS